jgi:creatinine amidohydrolase
MTWPEIGAALDGTGAVGLVPVGAVEQHGPHLPTGTDTIIASELCDRAAERSGAIALPAIGLGCSFGHGPTFPGTLSLSPESLVAVIRQYAEWAAASGLVKLLFVNCHMGNTPALLSATDHFRLARPDLQTGLINWWEATPEINAATVADGQDLHANRAETSLMLAVAPELVREELLGSSDDPDRTEDLVFRYNASSLSRNGVTGRPSEASRELGEQLLEAILVEIASRAARGRTEEPPLGRSQTPRFTSF